MKYLQNSCTKFLKQKRHLEHNLVKPTWADFMFSFFIYIFKTYMLLTFFNLSGKMLDPRSEILSDL